MSTSRARASSGSRRRCTARPTPRWWSPAARSTGRAPRAAARTFGCAGAGQGRSSSSSASKAPSGPWTRATDVSTAPSAPRFSGSSSRRPIVPGPRSGRWSRTRSADSSLEPHCGLRVCFGAGMDCRAVLAAYDEQIRRRPVPDLAGGWVERDRGVVRCISGPGAWNGITWTDLGSADVEAVIAAQIRAFAGIANGWEWKHHSYDQPADLPDRLVAAGFVRREAEALLVADL